MRFNGTSSQNIITGHDLSLRTGGNMSRDLHIGAVRMLHVTVIAETSKAIKVTPLNSDGKHSIWIPRSAVICKTKTLPGIGETNLYSLAHWYGREGFQRWFVERYENISVIGGSN